MEKEEIKNLMKDNFEEISYGDYINLQKRGKECSIFYLKNMNLFFKPKQKFPILYKLSCERIIEVEESGVIIFRLVNETDCFEISKSWNGIKELEILEKAVEKSKELRK